MVSPRWIELQRGGTYTPEYIYIYIVAAIGSLGGGVEASKQEDWLQLVDDDETMASKTPDLVGLKAASERDKRKGAVRGCLAWLSRFIACH